MKKNEDGKWEYLSKYCRRNDKLYASFSDTNVKYFSDNTIRSELPWEAFRYIRDEYRNSPLVLYVVIDEKIIRVQYYNPSSSPTMKIWHEKGEFFAYAPQKEIR